MRQSYAVGNGTANVSYEFDTILILSRPVNNAANFLAQLNATRITGYKDNASGTYVLGSEAYAAIANGYATVFYFSETKDGNTATAYHRAIGTYSYAPTPGTYAEQQCLPFNRFNLQYSRWRLPRLGG